ncbi:MAG: BLUF domain-containing protein [Hydrogenophaga sp.]|uniref:BLUF domain-containing protein n=1 Tax=Hydrogenophaga sp. TaxID=1904254 RepID=UPI002ABB9CB1|nr:BLUF domain-containing protein [Hydrogenophaga sp.]MDZ4104094.1 BLUF domain-containing protein [Hydrogenophaga sp.]
MNAPHTEQPDEPVPGHSSPLLYNLVYCSRATEGVDAAAVDQIIATSRRYNPARSITGLLVFGSGIFFQWLEGPRDSVLALMALLKKDPRHHTVVLLTSGEEVRERLFPDWDMELVTSDAVRDVLVDALESAQDPKNAESLRELLQQLDDGLLDGPAKD